MMELFEKAKREELDLRNRLNRIPGSWTDVLHQNKNLVKRYIEAHRNVSNWHELLALEETCG